ncbi:site-specific integrase [Alicyclobacillus sp. ALC3]|uniref:site-specific integrase n=1 Tax=Alicyclobacillus sp. ALC3 TaxID=2796143 RepID=UPI002378920B|nr:site-specific integrase [Alicyclobacillus sp. ALC3]WDL97942.1 site-specific integrase [Alicyclobacillus sp. ALC3]
MDELVIVEQQVTSAQPSLTDAFAAFLRMDVANGNAPADTVRGYKTQVTQWVEWCRTSDIDPVHAMPAYVKAYRLHLVQNGYKASSIAHKLTIIRRFLCRNCRQRSAH